MNKWNLLKIVGVALGIGGTVMTTIADSKLAKLTLAELVKNSK